MTDPLNLSTVTSLSWMGAIIVGTLPFDSIVVDSYLESIKSVNNEPLKLLYHGIVS